MIIGEKKMEFDKSKFDEARFDEKEKENDWKCNQKDCMWYKEERDDHCSYSPSKRSTCTGDENCLAFELDN